MAISFLGPRHEEHLVLVQANGVAHVDVERVDIRGQLHSSQPILAGPRQLRNAVLNVVEVSQDDHRMVVTCIVRINPEHHGVHVVANANGSHLLDPEGDRSSTHLYLPNCFQRRVHVMNFDLFLGRGRDGAGGGVALLALDCHGNVVLRGCVNGRDP